MLLLTFSLYYARPVLTILLFDGIDTQSTLNWLAFSSHFKTPKLLLNGNVFFFHHAYFFHII